MPGWTNKGKMRTLQQAFVRTPLPVNFYVALVTSAVAPDADTNTLSQLTQIAAGNGYTSGGFQLTPNATDFDTVVEDDATDVGYVQIKNVAWTASGGPIPASGGGARYAVLTDDNGTVGSREVYFYWDLVSDTSVTAGGTLTLADLTIRAKES